MAGACSRFDLETSAKAAVNTMDQELATKVLQIESKRFYLYLKQNQRGRFIKIVELAKNGRRGQINVALSTAAELRNHLTSFSEFYAGLGSVHKDRTPEQSTLKSMTMTKDTRIYFLDLKENARGRFLRVSQVYNKGGARSLIVLPAQGMIEFRDALAVFLEEFGTDDREPKVALPETRHLKVENRNFYFDVEQNQRGVYMRISEVKNNFRAFITIPENSWTQFRDIFNDFNDKMKNSSDLSSSTVDTQLETNASSYA